MTKTAGGMHRERINNDFHGRTGRGNGNAKNNVLLEFGNHCYKSILMNEKIDHYHSVVNFCVHFHFVRMYNRRASS